MGLVGILPKPVRHSKSLVAPDYNRAMTLFLILPNEELETILSVSRK